MDLLKLNKYEERNYAEIPAPEGFIKYGDDNLFPQYLIDLYKSSATHNALCNSIAYMIFGDGIACEDVDARLKIQEWGLNDEIRKACIDLKIQGGFALEVIYSIDRTTISKVRHCPFENIRSGDVDDHEKCEWYWYSKDWTDNRVQPEVVKAFDPQSANDYPVQILYVKPFSPGSYFYPKPDYIGSIDYIELDKEIGKYHINNIKNGLAPSFTIHFKNGVPSQEERFTIRNDIERQLAGATNAGKFIVTYSDSPERKPDFEPFPLSDADKQYEFLSREVSDKIMVGHRVVSSAMFGVKTAGQLGNTQELEVASQLFDRQVIKPYQRIVTNAVDSILGAAGTTAYVHIAEPEGVAIEAEKQDEEDKETYGIQTDLGEVPQTMDLNLACDLLIECGEDEDDEEWELVDARRVDYDTEALQDAMWTFAKVPTGKPQSKSEEQDTELIKVRYAYMPKKTGGTGIDPKTDKPYESRDFCKRMVAAGNRVWRKEDIDAASGANPGWGPNGSNTYDIWLYKGGGSCQHFWERRTYLRKNNKSISVNRARKIIREAGLEPMPKNDPKVAKRPRDMANRGFLPSNKNAKRIKTPK